MKIFVTGSPGVGKTTLIRTVVKQLASSIPSLTLHGFYTEELRHGGDRIGFDIVTLDGRRAPLARIPEFRTFPPSPGNASNPNSAPASEAPLPATAGGSARGHKRALGREGSVGKYVVDIAAVEAFLLPILSQQCTEEPATQSVPHSGRLTGPDNAPTPIGPEGDAASSAPARNSGSGDATPPFLAPPPVAAEAGPPISRGGSARDGGSSDGTSQRDGSAQAAAESAAGHSTGLRSAPVLWVVDEVGRMELLCPAFFSAVWALLEAPGTTLLGSIPTPRYGRDIPQVEQIRQRADVEVLQVTRGNADALAAEVEGLLWVALQSPS